MNFTQRSKYGICSFIFHTLKCLKIIKLPHLNNAGTEFVKHRVRYNGNLIVPQYYIDARTGKAIYTHAHILLWLKFAQIWDKSELPVLCSIHDIPYSTKALTLKRWNLPTYKIYEFEYTNHEYIRNVLICINWGIVLSHQNLLKPFKYFLTSPRQNNKLCHCDNIIIDFTH